jgi:hypothetical protein
MEKLVSLKKSGTPLYPGISECVGYIPAKSGSDEKLLKIKSGKWSQNWDYTISDLGYTNLFIGEMNTQYIEYSLVPFS